jgi:Ca2+-binding EF-hand superfamily protein
VSLVVSTGPCSVTPEGEGESAAIMQTAQALYDGFVAADTNHDGLLSLAEAQAARPQFTTADFKYIDTNSDGTISQNELAAYLKPDTGCVCTKSDFTLGGLWKRLGDFFLGALGLAVLTLSAGRRAR